MPEELQHWYHQRIWSIIDKRGGHLGGAPLIIVDALNIAVCSTGVIVSSSIS
ncbi:hypothetical protein GBAR_LOCUS19579 [Geodia barretti]|uniref:Uncharacterized protein n=1 Tax=Geodia barretti TaxID=519541 RepID=A0AA35WV05_GEOBA|nr:hypothetical protein GBAR_LOCUS19579 [Geodia barretti]